MLQIIAKIPLFVWPLFVLLLVGGLKARKTSAMPLTVLLLIPAGFFSWSLYTFFGRYTDPLTIFLWILCLGIGFFIGFWHMQRLKLQFDKQRKKVIMPGSWIPLILSMSIFTSKFSVGMLRSSLEGSTLLLGLELFSTVILGVFVGRGISVLKLLTMGAKL